MTLGMKQFLNHFVFPEGTVHCLPEERNLNSECTQRICQDSLGLLYSSGLKQIHNVIALGPNDFPTLFNDATQTILVLTFIKSEPADE